jgi:hypothetical protein
LDYYTIFRFNGAQNKWYFGADGTRSYMQTGLSHDMWFGPGCGGVAGNCGNSLSNTPTLVLTAGGKAGVNDTAPGANLSVVGNAQIGYSSGQTAPSNGLIVQGLAGIGTTTPWTKLEVAGTVKVGDGNEICNTTNYAGGIRYTSAKTVQYCDGTAWRTVASSGAGGVTAAGSSKQVQFNSGGILGASANLNWDNANGRLGIGTATPATSLETVTSSGSVFRGRTTSATGYTELTLLNDQNNVAAHSLVLGYSGSSYGGFGGLTGEFGYFGTNGNYPFSIFTNNTVRITTLANGNVGIGTTTPGVTFDVLGPHVAGIGLARLKGNGQFGFVTADTSASSVGSASGFLAAINGVKKAQLDYEVSADSTVGGVNIYNATADANNSKLILR